MLSSAEEVDQQLQQAAQFQLAFQEGRLGFGFSAGGLLFPVSDWSGAGEGDEGRGRQGRGRGRQGEGGREEGREEGGEGRGGEGRRDGALLGCCCV